MRTVRIVIGSSILVAGAAAGAVPAAAVASPPAAPAPLTAPSVRVFAAGSAQTFGPDDIVTLGPDIFIGWQDGVGPTGAPGPTGNRSSTLVEYQPDGTTVAQWSVVGHLDGLAADPAHDRVIATVNEDANSSLYTIDASGPPTSALRHYAYAPSGPLPHGGGTDSVVVTGGQILISASAPTDPGGPAVYRASLSGSTALLQPLFFDNSTAVVANRGSDQNQVVRLALTDPDSSTVVPAASPRFGGDFLLDSQGDEEQVYVSGVAGSRPGLSVLRLAQSVNDTAFVTAPTGTLYATDNADNEVFALTGTFGTGTALTAVTPGDADHPVNAPGYLGQLDLSTGAITPVVTTIRPTGLAFVAAPPPAHT